jgi:alkyl sulfatase BDS1-like metallo-beta-lactamase superfamily hydrolase
LKETLAGLSDKPVHTVILTHHHVDHALGAWALLDSENRPDIIATDEFLVQQQNDIYLSAFRTRRNHQSPADAPRGWDDVVRPTHTFSGSLELSIGGETFALQAARGETADQLYVFVPGRKTLVTADYYQRFIPNAGNGRRPQRYPAEWSRALHDMAALDAELMIPMHGPVLTDPDEIRDRLTAHAELLASLDRQVADALNRGQPEHTIPQGVALPKKFLGRDDVAELYVSVGDISRMILHEYTGWWDDVPSHWNPAPLSAEAAELARLAGGAEKLAERALELAPGDIRLACQLADWAWLAEPRNPAVLKTSYELYLQRLRGPVPTQEALAYVDHLVALRVMINMLNGDAK